MISEDQQDFISSHYDSKVLGLELAPDTVTHNDLNNFPAKVEGWYREDCRTDPEYSTATVRECLQKITRDTADFSRECLKHSPRFLDHTFEHFFNEFDRVLKELGIKEKAEELFRSFSTEKTKEAVTRGKIRQELIQLVLPAYVKMRALGYGHIDLWQ